MQHRVRLSIDFAEGPARPGTVLLVSDDGQWREVAGRVLRQEGYHVLDARHENHALVVSAHFGGAVDLLISDHRHDGRRSDFPARLFEDHPNLRVLHFETRPGTREALLTAARDALR